MEQSVAAMRVASVTDTPLLPGEQRGMAMDTPASVTMPEEVWHEIWTSVLVLATVVDILVTVERVYHRAKGTATVKFARRRGEV
jgi:hypothetical protein